MQIRAKVARAGVFSLRGTLDSLSRPGNPQADAGGGGGRVRSAPAHLRNLPANPQTPERQDEPQQLELQAPRPRSWQWSPRMRAEAVRCLDVSMATKSVGWWSPSEKMKLKSLLLRYYPPGTGRPPSAFTWRSAPGGSAAEEKCWGPSGGVQSR